jgi:uncharacterized protein (DUF302 family)
LEGQMGLLRSIVVVAAFILVTAAPAAAQDGFISKPSAHSAAVTLDRLESALKERGFMIFTRLDHARAASSMGLTMPASTVLVFGNPRLGTPAFIRNPSLAIDLPLKALVYEDSTGKVWIGYNAPAYVFQTVYARHGAPVNPEVQARVEAVLAEATDIAAK